MSIPIPKVSYETDKKPIHESEWTLLNEWEQKQ